MSEDLLAAADNDDDMMAAMGFGGFGALRTCTAKQFWLDTMSVLAGAVQSALANLNAKLFWENYAPFPPCNKEVPILKDE